MTAEVAVMNRRGIALAADSAVTVTLDSGTRKIYTSAEKLFLLVEQAPVGLMFYGDTGFLGVPWETVVRLYRRQLGTTLYDTLADYAEGFLEYLESERTLFPDEVQRAFVEPHARKLYADLVGEFEKRLTSKLEAGELDEGDTEAFFAGLVRNELERARERPPLQALPDDFPALLRVKYEEMLDGVIGEVLEDRPPDQATSADLKDYVCEVLSREHPNAPGSGIVIAGFGEREHYPSLVEYELRGIAANRVLFRTQRHHAIGLDSIAYIEPFAQREMVHTFMNGIHPAMRDLIRDSTEHLFYGMFEVIAGEACEQEPRLRELFETELAPQVGAMLRSLFDDWDTNEQDQHSGPVMDIVATLPKDELAGMAEALVNLTKFRRHVSTDLETVGGPIDVAVISKGDGFVWIKRKHYFRPELNQRLMARYYREAPGD